MKTVMALAVCGLIVGGCASSGGGNAKLAGRATDAQRSALFDRVKTLQGTWVAKDDKGQEHTVALFALSSSGSVVREIMLPGSEQEMTNVYHMDGPTLVMTHYCAMGNQPRLRAVAGDPNVIDLKFDSVTNLQGSEYMGGLKITFKDGKAQPHAMFALTRKK